MFADETASPARKKIETVGPYVKVEIGKAVDENGYHTGNGRDEKIYWIYLTSFQEQSVRFMEQDNQEPRADKERGDAALGKKLYVVVMGMVGKRVSRYRAVFWIYVEKGTEARPCQWEILNDITTVFPNPYPQFGHIARSIFYLLKSFDNGGPSEPSHGKYYQDKNYDDYYARPSICTPWEEERAKKYHRYTQAYNAGSRESQEDRSGYQNGWKSEEDVEVSPMDIKDFRYPVTKGPVGSTRFIKKEKA